MPGNPIHLHKLFDACTTEEQHIKQQEETEALRLSVYNTFLTQLCNATANPGELWVEKCCLFPTIGVPTKMYHQHDIELRHPPPSGILPDFLGAFLLFDTRPAICSAILQHGHSLFPEYHLVFCSIHNQNPFGPVTSRAMPMRPSYLLGAVVTEKQSWTPGSILTDSVATAIFGLRRTDIASDVLWEVLSYLADEPPSWEAVKQSLQLTQVSSTQVPDFSPAPCVPPVESLQSKLRDYMNNVELRGLKN
eukprot:TRINITY_DN22835_c0_g1_i1.p1 TRINITY_DN22835_c0_g1~~TRINITY_DN22835_c0_g1_i1.p1  ORF type:complete len:269 (-),score=1.72 TRINITY_DN22835_c0_g1_i1:92-838(-)